MKKLILSLLTVAACFTAFGQTDYYTGKTEIVGKNATYSCQDYKTFFQLTNVNKVFIGKKQMMIDGTPVDESHPAIPYSRGMNDPDRAMLHRAFREAFTPEQVAALKEQEGGVTIYFYADSGGIIKDVSLLITRTPTSVSIPPDQWFTLEQKLKQYVTAKQEICKNFRYADFFVVFKFNEL